MRGKGLIVFLVLIVPACGFSQVQDSLLETAIEKKGHSYITPSAFFGYGLVSLANDNFLRRLDYSTHAELREDHSTFRMKADDYMRHASALAVYGLDLAGVEAKTDFLDRSMKLLASYILVSASVTSLKRMSNRTRPNGINDNSFPSSHTATAFMTAEFLHQEYKHQSVLYSIGGYTVATATGVLRLYNNAHWVSDVIAGAGIGILSTKFVYLAYPYISQKLFHNKPVNMLFSPGYQSGMLYFRVIKPL